MLWLHGPGRWLVVFVGLSRRRRRLHLVGCMVGGGVDRIDLHWRRADVGDVVPSPRRIEDTPAPHLLACRMAACRQAAPIPCSGAIAARILSTPKRTGPAGITGRPCLLQKSIIRRCG